MTHTTIDKTPGLISLPAHSLLEPPSPAYSNVTVRRAFIVWMLCGQRNSFQHVCNYYHYLEALEDKLPAEKRALSRHHEFDLFSNQPPTSKYLTETFPHLYSSRHVEPAHIKKLESIRNDPCIFKLEGFNEIPRQKGTTTEEIVEASRIIRKYCKSQLIPLRKFLAEFKSFATRCELDYTVNTVASYIKRKMLQAELNIINNMPKTFSFLESDDEEDIVKTVNSEITKPKTEKAPKIIEKYAKTSILDYALTKPKEVKSKESKENVKLNGSCAAFFNSFNTKYSYFEQKSVSCSPLSSSSAYNISNGHNVSYGRLKSRSVESLLCNNFNVKSKDALNSPLMNFDDWNRLRRI